MGAGTAPGPAGGGEERRHTQRMPILGYLRGEVMVFQPMGITEMGRGGVQVETTFPLHLDSLHDLRLELGHHTLVVKGRVTHCSIIDVDQELVRYRSGIQFVDAPEHVTSVIAAFLDRVAGDRRGV
jgi:hypothetical protein